ncbi:hypothetical protein [Paenibacillus sp. KN14-4R]|uniref:hypothetical protein n=1 Tax=Paenibacillus sp. KN14-4R TaxID=3445773 RepID=UPI003FA0C302
MIGYFYVFGAIVLLVSLFFSSPADEISVSMRMGLSWVPEGIMRVVLAAFTLILSYLYLKLTVIGFWLMVLYSCYFSIVSVYLAIQSNSQPFIGNFIFSGIVLIYTIFRRKEFINKKL